MTQWLSDRIESFADRPCFIHQEQTHSYGDLASEIRKIEQTLEKSDIREGDLVLLKADYSLQSVATLLALFNLRVIVAPATALSSSEIASRISAANLKWQVSLRGKNLEILATTNADPTHSLVASLQEQKHPGLILFSSGSTGKPKAMVHDANHLLKSFEKKRTRRLSILIFLLFDHIGGLNTLFNGLASGAKIIIPESRNPHKVARAIQAHAVKLLPASPTFLNLLILSGACEAHDLSSLRFVTYGTEPMPESLLKRLKHTLPHTKFIQTFGTSETGISQTISRASDSTQIKIEDPNTEYKIVDGELWLRSDNQILGYLNHEMSQFTEDGWFKTGDSVLESNDGYLTIVGRREDIINVGGEKVTPSEVENILLEIPEVADCLVYGEDNAITGQNVAAQIVPHERTDLNALKRKIKNHCRKSLNHFKVPARILFPEAELFGKRFKKTRKPIKENDD
ncbi:MAG: 2-succinylbenzoate--CoA ligase [Opitutia bacterium UBA7350]|nr:MAG: 2-succinylbenzoate--CoA ligase [Opitutae bacterium UBA7350]